jgi:hypothetical protein
MTNRRPTNFRTFAIAFVVAITFSFSVIAFDKIARSSIDLLMPAGAFAGKCRECGGDGKCAQCGGNKTERCNKCNGTGEKDGAKCSACNGKGDFKCSKCEGSGKCFKCKGSGKDD